MADEKTFWTRMGLTPLKATLVAVLSVALVAVLYIEYGARDGGDASPKKGGAEALNHDSAAAGPTANQSSPPGTAVATAVLSDSTLSMTKLHPPSGDAQAARRVFDASRWKSPQLSKVTAYDPFAMTDAFPKPRPVTAESTIVTEASDNHAAAEQRAKELADAVLHWQRQLEELQQRGVHVIVGGGKQYVAIIGDRTLHVGDDINGFTVTAIDADGVRVEKKGTE